MSSIDPTVVKTCPIKELPGYSYSFTEMSVAEHLWFVELLRYMGTLGEEVDRQFSLFHLKVLLTLLSIQHEGDNLLLLKADSILQPNEQGENFLEEVDSETRLGGWKVLGFERATEVFYNFMEEASKEFCDLCYSKYIAEADNLYFDLGTDLKKKADQETSNGS